MCSSAYHLKIGDMKINCSGTSRQVMHDRFMGVVWAMSRLDLGPLLLFKPILVFELTWCELNF